MGELWAEDLGCGVRIDLGIYQNKGSFMEFPIIRTTVYQGGGPPVLGNYHLEVHGCLDVMINALLETAGS